MQENYPLALRLGEKLYHFSFPCYRPLYFTYKKLSDARIIRFLKRSIRPGMRGVEIGANIGFYASLFSRLVGEHGLVIAFEPEAENFSKLQSTLGNRKNVQLVQRAVCNVNNTIQLYLSEELNVDHQTYCIGEERRTTETQAVRLDDFLSNVPSVDFLKIDIQGHDYLAMKGMRRLLTNSPRIVIVGEVFPYGLKKSGASVTEYLQYLQSFGIELGFFDLKSRRNFSGLRDTVAFLESKSDDKFYYTDFWGRGRAHAFT